MKRIIFYPLLAAFFGLDIFFTATVSASGLVPCGGPGQTDCTVCHFFLLTKDALYYSLALSSLIAGVLLAVSGLNLMANRGNIQSTGRSKKVITVVLVGLAIIFAGWAGVNTYFVSAGAAEWDGFSLDRDWWKIKAECGQLVEKPMECGDGIVQAENDEECDPNEKIPSCQGRTGFSEEECDKAIAGCNAYCKLELVSDDDDDDNDDTGNDDVADDDDDDVTVDDDSDDDDEVVVMCSEENKNKVGLGCWPGEDDPDMVKLKKEARKELDKKYKEYIDEYIKMMKEAGQELTKEQIAEIEKSYESAKLAELDAFIQAEIDKVTDPDKRKIFCGRGKYECDKENKLVCVALVPNIYDECCLNGGKDLANMSFEFLRDPKADCGARRNRGEYCSFFTCDEICKQRNKVCIGVGLADVARNHCATVRHDVAYDCNYSGNLTSNTCRTSLSGMMSGCCEKGVECNKSIHIHCCDTGEGVEFAVGESACYCK